MKRTEESLRDLWDNIKHTNIQVIGVPDEAEKRKALRKILNKLQLKTSPTWERKQSSPRSTESPLLDKPKEDTSRHILMKLTEIKHKEKILKAARESNK